MNVSHSLSTKFLVSSLIIIALILTLCLFQNSQKINLHASGNVTFLFGSIDTMKESRDSSCTGCQITYAQIQNDVNLSATLNNNYITVDTFWDYPSYVQLWVNAVRATGKHVWFRGHPNQWEDDNGTTGIMTPTSYLTAEHNFITSNPSLFQQGDIFDPCAEPENGAYWQSSYGSNWSWQPAAPNTATDDYNSFLVNTTNTANTAFAQIGVTGVTTTVHSTNEWFAVNPALYASTVTAMGRVTIDSYPDQSTTDPTTAANAWVSQLNAIESYRNVPVVIGEMGYDNSTQVSDTVQHNVISAELAAIQNLTFIQGLNYWVGAGGSGYGGYTNIFTGGKGNWSLRPAAYDIASFFATALAPTPTPTPLPIPSPDPQPNASYSTNINLSGIKDSSIVTVFVNGTSIGVTYPDSTHWQLNNFNLSLGNNTISIYGEDASNNTSSTTTISVYRHKVGDINGDGSINLTDLSIFAIDWLHSGVAIVNPLSDMNGDNIVNLTDLSIFASTYGT